VIPSWQDGLLPPGIHWAKWDEIEERFGTTEHRRALLAGLHMALLSLAAAGCRSAYIDGSFVTDKQRPNDFDACWDPNGVDLDALDPLLLELAHPRATQKARFGGELFPNVAEAGSGSLFVDFFQTDRDTGGPKGIVAIDLRRLA
jgi:hypothetical protein